MKLFSLITLMALLLTSCQPRPDEDYVRQLSANRIDIDPIAGLDNPGEKDKVTMRRAAKATLANGYTHFICLDFRTFDENQSMHIQCFKDNIPPYAVDAQLFLDSLNK